jgi:hypothetical protein
VKLADISTFVPVSQREERCAYCYDEELEGKGCTRKDNIEMDLKAVRYEDVGLNHVTEGWDQRLALLNTLVTFRICQQIGKTILLQSNANFIFILGYMFRSLWIILKSCYWSANIIFDLGLILFSVCN